VTDAIRSYLDAQEKYENVSNDLANIVNILESVSKNIKQNPGGFSFSNTKCGLPPSAIFATMGNSINANDWKSAEEIQQLLSQWHAARDSVRNAWNAVPVQDRKHLHEPKF